MNQFIQTCRAWGKKVGLVRYIWLMALRQFIKRILRRDIRYTLSNGRKLILPKWSGFASVVFVTGGKADDGCEEIMECFGDPNRYFCDIGAHFGYWGVRMAHCSKGIIAIEPNPICYDALQENLVAIGNQQIAKCALSDHVSSLRFFADMSPPHSRLLGPTEELPKRRGEILSIPVQTLDQVWRDGASQPIWGVKIDTEGHEASVLQGAHQMIETCEPLLLIETNRDVLALYSNYFTALGYEAGWLSKRQLGERQTLRIVPIDSALLEFAADMLFLFPRWTRSHKGWSAVERLFLVMR